MVVLDTALRRPAGRDASYRSANPEASKSVKTLNDELRISAAGSALGIGIVLGTAASWALARPMTGFLFGVTSNDPVTFLGMVIVLTTVAVAAGYLPARRASRIDPMSALRAS